MELYRVTLKLESPIITALKGDTIWGHIVWGIANHEGDEAVKSFLEASKKDEPPMIVSSAFPNGTICKPLPEPQARLDSMTKEDYAAIKKSKKEKYSPACDFFDGISKVDTTAKPFETISVMHNTISRIDNTVAEGGLYATDEIFFTEKLFDIYILSVYSSERIKELCCWAFENGYGADASTGKGKISVEGFPQKVQTKKSGNKYVALAPFVCKDFAGIKNLRADTFVRTGKIGGFFVATLPPWKKTVILYNEGAVFESDKHIKFVGNLLTDIHSDPRICHAGFAPVIPIE